MPTAVIATGLSKSYGSTRALIELDLAVEEGTMVALLGPNGAGKTTVVRILTTLLRPDAGSAMVAGVDVLRHPKRARECIGLAGQYAAVDELLTGGENLEMVGRLYGLTRAAARTRAGELLERLELADARDRLVRTYSGGMRRRLDLAASIVYSPPVLILDEPTTGLDPRSRIALWEIVTALVEAGTSVLLTTQYLEEADRLANRIVVVDHGRVIAEGTPGELKARFGADRLEVVVSRGAQLGAVRTMLSAAGSTEPIVDEDERRVAVAVHGGAAALLRVVRELDALGIAVDDVGLRRATMDDVFLRLTGPASPAATDASKDAAGTGAGR
ncbi:MAG: daunorubicin resistance protein DrrA family ABC transporter ATP-binding protein [Candidatus Dormibacteria bacterium]